MSWDFLEIFDVVTDAVDLFVSGSSSSNTGYDEKSRIKKKSKYFVEKISAGFLLAASVLFFFVFKDPIPTENYLQTLIVGSLIGLAVSLLFFFILYALEKYYFKSVFQWLFFSCSTILLAISVVFCVYFESGLFV